MNLSDLSKTALVTLIFRAIAAEQNLISDPMAIVCLNNLLTEVPAEERKRIIEIKKRESGKSLTKVKVFVQRATWFDKMTNDFISAHPSSTVINLGCGFDTRFWRINHEKCRYIDLDLPEVIELKKAALKGHSNYEQLGFSVLDLSWIDRVISNGNSNFLLIAEGLLVFLPEKDVRKLLDTISKKFNNSQIVFNVVPLKFTKGIWRFIFKRTLKKIMGVNLAYLFGLKKPNDMEDFAPGINVIDHTTIEGIWYINAGINKK